MKNADMKHSEVRQSLSDLGIQSIDQSTVKTVFQKAA